MSRRCWSRAQSAAYQGPSKSHDMQRAWAPSGRRWPSARSHRVGRRGVAAPSVRRAQGCALALRTPGGGRSNTLRCSSEVMLPCRGSTQLQSESRGGCHGCRQHNAAGRSKAAADAAAARARLLCGSMQSGGFCVSISYAVMISCDDFGKSSRVSPSVSRGPARPCEP